MVLHVENYRLAQVLLNVQFIFRYIMISRFNLIIAP